MTPEREQFDHRQYAAYPPQRQGINLRLVALMLFGVVVFGAACIAAGVYAVGYLNRLDSLEKSLAARNDYAQPAPSAPADRQQAASAQSMTSNTSQPQIYFMVGGQGGGYGPSPYQAASAGYYPSAPAHQALTEADRYLLQQYGSDYAEYMRQRQKPLAGPIHSYPGARNDLLAMAGTRFSDGIVVPVNLTLDLRKRFTRNELVEQWFKDEAKQNFGQGKDGDRLPGTPEPSMDDILKSLADTNFADKNYERAARIYAELASRQVHMTKAELQQWAKASELSGDIESALKIMNLVYQHYPEDNQVLKEMASLLVGNQRFAEAADIYGKLMELEPGEREWRVMRGKTLTWSGRGKEAVPLLQALHKETPNDWDLSVMLAELLLSEHMYEEALPLLDTMIAARPDDDKLKNNKIDALEALQRFGPAADMIEDLLTRSPDDEKLLLKLAKDRVAAGQYLKAVPSFEKYLAANPEDYDIRLELAEALMAGQSFAAAATQFGLVSDARPEDLVVKAKYANALMAAQDFDRASYVYSYLVEDKPGDRELAMGYVVSLRMSKNPQAAYDAALMHLSVDPNDSKMMFQAAEIAFELEGKYKESIKWFRSALRINPQNADWRIAIGNVLIWGQEYAAAEAEFRSALVHNPQSLKARRGLGRALFFQRKYDDAWKTFEDLILYDPMNPAIVAEMNYYKAISVGMEDEAQRQLLILMDAEPEEITWKGDRVQSLLRQHRFEEAGEAAKVVYEQDPEYRTTRVGMMNMDEYLTTYPVQLRGGYLRKKSEESDNPEQDRQANLSYKWIGVHGEGSYGYNWRIGADFDREYFGMHSGQAQDVKASRLKGSVTYEGDPSLWGRAELGYRWFNNSDRSDLKDQVLYDVRGELRELGNMALNLGVYTRRREHYDNWMNVYDNLYAYDFGVDATYRWKKWDFSGRLQGTVLTDNNSAFNAMAMARYRLIETPCTMLELGPDVEYTDWKYNRPEYFSPQDYWQMGFAIDGRSYLCRDPEVWGGPATWIDYGLMFYRDRFGSFGQKMFLGFNHDFSTKFSVFGRVDYSHESYYDELKLFGGMQYKFGGCEE